MWKKILLIPLAIVLVAVIYLLNGPKIVLVNDSASAYDEVVVTTPSSRVTFSPVLSASSKTAHISPQHGNGPITYTLFNRGRVLSQGSVSYPRIHSLRTITVTIQSGGSVSLSTWP